MPHPLEADVAVVGAGLGGTAAATVIARAGHRVVLIDSHAAYPREFRAEKLGGVHMSLVARLGLAEAALPALTPIDAIDIHRPGARPVRHRVREYGFAYPDLIDALRAGLPAGVDFRVGRVDSVATGPDRQHLALADGTRVAARLLVIATGLGEAVRRAVGIGRVVTSEAHSLSLGFFLDRPAAAYPFASLAFYGRGPADRTAYLSLFPVGARMRANLFVYRAVNEDWTRSVRHDPAAGLAALFPGLERVCAGLGVEGRVQVRPVDLTVSEGYRRDGVVLIGDAFLTTCPAPGVGVRRVLTDVERLAAHLPGWLAGPDMAADRFAAFYDDPAKRRSDAEAIRASRFARAMAVEPGLVWAARRLRNGLVRRALARFGREPADAMPTMVPVAAGGSFADLSQEGALSGGPRPDDRTPTHAGTR